MCYQLTDADRLDAIEQLLALPMNHLLQNIKQNRHKPLSISSLLNGHIMSIYKK